MDETKCQSNFFPPLSHVIMHMRMEPAYLKIFIFSTIMEKNHKIISYVVVAAAGNGPWCVWNVPSPLFERIN